jgi:protein-L-isoaspartate(D-aspartate) O-methyltransferase
LAGLILGSVCFTVWAGASKEQEQRTAMVEKLRQRGINNKTVLTAMGEVARHLFVKKELRARAYDETTLPVANGQILQTPACTASELSCLDLQNNERVLQVGAECGYYTAILSAMKAKVFVVDLRRDVLQASQERLKSLNYTSPKWRNDKGCQGWAEFAPYDAILVTCAADQVPPALLDQLKTGGHLVIPIGVGPERTVQCLSKRPDGKMRTEALNISVKADFMSCRHPLP